MNGVHDLLNNIKTDLEKILENWKNVILMGIYNREMLTDEIETMLRAVRNNIELTELTIKSNPILGEVRITIVTDVGVFTAIDPYTHPKRLSTRVNKSVSSEPELNIPSELNYSQLDGYDFTHSIKLKNTESEEDKIIIVKEFNNRSFEQGDSLETITNYFKTFMYDPKFYRVCVGDDDVYTFMCSEDLKNVSVNVSRDFDILIQTIGLVSHYPHRLYINSSTSTDFLTNFVNMYPNLKNISFVGHTDVERLSVKFDWLDRSWQVYM